MVRILGLSLLLLAGCETYDLESEERIYRPRILAMRIDPPEAGAPPGAPIDHFLTV